MIQKLDIIEVDDEMVNSVEIDDMFNSLAVILHLVELCSIEEIDEIEYVDEVIDEMRLYDVE